MRIALWVAAALGALILAYGGYLTVRVMEERAAAPGKVRAILAAADPAIAAIPRQRIAMLLRVEDPTFWSNDGIDLSSPGAGLTTLSQGLGKHIFFRHFRQGPMKIELMTLTRFALTPTVSKRDILTAALADAYLGNDGAGPVTGFAEGARRWLHKDLGALSDHEFLQLVAMLPAPNDLDPARHAAANAERVARIERLLAGLCQPKDVGDVMLEGCAVSASRQ